MLPRALKSGMKYKEFFKSTMSAVIATVTAYEDNRKETFDMIEFSAWVYGRYTADAIMCTIGNTSWFHAKGSPPNQYPKNPLAEREEKKANPNKEANEELAVFEMKKRIKMLAQSGLPESPS